MISASYGAIGGLYIYIYMIYLSIEWNVHCCFASEGQRKAAAIGLAAHSLDVVVLQGVGR